MRILEFEENKGKIKIKIEDEEDLWLLDTIISQGDIVYAHTTREIKQRDAVRSKSSKRIPMFLGIKVTATEYQPFTNKLRIRGVIVEGPEEFGLKGHYHTLSVGVGSELAVVKEKGWSPSLIRKIKSSEKLKHKIAIVAIDSDETALGIIYRYGVRIVFSEPTNFPGKNDIRREILFKKRLEEISQKILDLLTTKEVKALIIVGPGFIKDHLTKTIKNTLRMKNIKINIITDHSSSGGVKGVYEAIKSGTLENLLKEFELSEKEKLFNELMRKLLINEKSVAIGVDDVYKAAEFGAVDYLLILDQLLKSMLVESKEKIEKILENVEKHGGKIWIYTIHQEAGVQLKALGGIAAILRYSINY